MIVIALIGVVTLFVGINAQIGAICHANIFQFTPRHSLNTSQYMGDWYVHEIAGSNIGNFPPPSYRCARRTFSLPDVNDESMIISVDSSVNKTDGVFIQETREIMVNATRSPYSSLWYETAVATNVTTQTIILAVDLDMAEWTVVYSCSILPPNRYRYEVVTALSRSRSITAATRNTLKALMVGVGFRIGDHQTVDQVGC